MYKPLLVNVSVSLIVSGVQPHMTILLGLSCASSLDIAAGVIVILTYVCMSSGSSILCWVLTQSSNRPGVTFSWTSGLILALRRRNNYHEDNDLNRIPSVLQEHAKCSCATFISSKSSDICYFCYLVRGSMLSNSAATSSPFRISSKGIISSSLIILSSVGGWMARKFRSLIDLRTA